MNGPDFTLLNEKLPVDETVVAITRAHHPRLSSGYLALTTKRLVFASAPYNAPADALAIPLGDINDVTFGPYDRGTGLSVKYANTSLELSVEIIMGDHNFEENFCSQLRSRVREQGPYAL